MVIEVGDKLISTDIFEEEFVCNLSACKGACCIDGTDGAPLTREEVDLLEENLEDILPYVSTEGQKALEEGGVYYIDIDNEPVTSLVKGKECAFVTTDEQGIAKCGIENAYREGKISFNKPISCHLYPIRVRKMNQYEVLNYDRWPICSDACTLGKELKVPVYKFLKEPLIRKYGADFYKELERIAAEIKSADLGTE